MYSLNLCGRVFLETFLKLFLFHEDKAWVSRLLFSQHKKLVEGTLYEEVTSASYSENDISNSLKNGILYLEDPIDHVSVCACPQPWNHLH